MDVKRAGPSTRAIHAGEIPAELGGGVVNPVVRSTTFYNAPEGGGEIRYSRYGNAPNGVLLEARIAALEGAAACVVVGSGMAAIGCALLSLLRTGDHVVAAEALYGGTRTLLDRELTRLGIETTYVDLFSSDWEEAFGASTRVLLLEMPSNPLTRVVELASISARAHARGAAVVVDSTLATPINHRPLEHGADLVVHSATKYFGGHSDVTGGAVAGDEARIAEVRARTSIWGPALDPQAAWLLERGIKTLPLRMERHNRNALEVARWCDGRAGISRVHHPGLASHPDHEATSRVLDGFGGIMGIEIAGGGTAATRFVRALRLAKVAPSLGGVETLVSEPRHTSHVGLTPEERERTGIQDGFVRFSVGIEDAADIIADIEGALGALAGE